MESYMIIIPDAVPEAHRDIFSKLMEDHNTLIRDLFKWLVQPCLDFIRHECKLFVTTSPLHLVHSLLNLYTCILDDLIAHQEGDPISQKQVRNSRFGDGGGAILKQQHPNFVNHIDIHSVTLILLFPY